MGTEPEYKLIDWTAALSELEAKRAAIERAIASLREIIASGVMMGVRTEESTVVPLAASSSNYGGDIPTGAFLGKSIPEAAKLCLLITKRKMTTREISDALLKGGMETTSKKFPTILHSILMRSARSDSPEIVKLERHWGLASWYPAGVRSGGQSQQKRKKATRKARAKASPQVSAVESKPQERILKAIQSQPGTEVSAKELADQLKMGARAINMVLINLAKKNVLHRTPSGKYKIAA